MRTLSLLSGSALAGLVLASASIAHADPALRKQVDQRGDFLLIGNTMGHECLAGTPNPIVGAVGTACSSQSSNSNRNDTSPDAYWNNGTLLSSTSQIGNARTTAKLDLPAGATVTHAYLYWAGTRSTADDEVSLRINGGSASTVKATQTWTVSSGGTHYQSFADVTALVEPVGTGTYEVSGIATNEFYNVNVDVLFGGWSMVVLYQLDTEPPRNLAVFDGLDVVSSGNNKTVKVSGFVVPNSGFDGKLGIVAYEGDNTLTGDRLFFHPTTTVPGNGQALTTANNPADNFFNGSRTWLGAAVSTVGDLPQLSGAPQSMSGIDLDVVDITSKLAAGQTAAYATGTSTGDTYFPGVWITSISTFKPDFSTSSKSVSDVNGGAVLVGDTLTYTIGIQNTGNDASIETVLTDALPAGVTYVPGSLRVDGATVTDAAGDDRGEYDAASRTITVRLGTDATTTTGGTLDVGAGAKVIFQVTIDAGASGTLENQATVTASGKLGAPETTTPTDGNGPVTGAPPTAIDIDECDDDHACPGGGICDTSGSPNVCVECLGDNDCGGPNSGQLCDDATNTCFDGCDGLTDGGCAGDAICTSSDATIGVCVECLTNADCGGADSGSLCDLTDNTCFAGCDAAPGDGCPAPSVCSSSDLTVGVCVTPIPTITGPAKDSTVFDTTPEFTGGCIPDYEVHVYEGATELCSATCDATGAYGCSPTTPLSPGGHIVHADQSSGGSTSGDSGPHPFDVAICLDTTAGTGQDDGCTADAPICMDPGSIDAQCVECRDVDDCGEGLLCEVASHTCYDPIPHILTPTDGSTVADTTPSITGTCRPGSEVEVYEGAALICSATCSAEGAFACEPADPLTPGDHTIHATQTKDGSTSEPSPDRSFTVTLCTSEEGDNGCPTERPVCLDPGTASAECVECRTDDQCGPGQACAADTHTCGDATTGAGGSGGDVSGAGGSGGDATGTGGAGNGSGAVDPTDYAAEGSGLLCSASPKSVGSSGAGWLVAFAAAALTTLRRRKRG